MKQLLVLLIATLSIGAFGQTELLDSIRTIQIKKTPNLGVYICTPDYWMADSEGGIGTFKQICRWPDEVELRLFKEEIKETRAVLTADIYFEGVPKDRIYMYFIKNADSWLLDGFNETEALIPEFLAGNFSGHFSPFDLPIDMELKDFGDKLLAFGRDDVKMLEFLKENTTPGSELDFISQMTTDLNFDPHIVNSFRYDKRLNRGYIHFMGKHKYEDNYYSEITIYVSKTESGKLKILSRLYSGPYTSGFLSN